jgi:hypothetical protein
MNRRLSWKVITGLQPTQLFCGAPHRDSHRYQRFLEAIFPTWNSRTGKLRVQQTAKLPKSTLYDWKSSREQDPNWRPWMQDTHGCHNRIFSGKEEAGLSRTILEDFIVPGKFFNSAVFHELAYQKFAGKGLDPSTFVCSNPYLRFPEASSVFLARISRSPSPANPRKIWHQ